MKKKNQLFKNIINIINTKTILQINNDILYGHEKRFPYCFLIYY